MNEITVNNYETLKNELSKELISTAQSVCRIGYLLKLARDTDILGEKYADVYEFASSEFGLDKSQVSRFMNINDRFSVDGNSEQLLPEYSQYGSSKLSIMLTLPDEINEELSPEMTKSDILAVKEEYEEEQNTTPIERMTEDTTGIPDEFIAAVVKQLNDEHPEPAELVHEVIEDIDREFDAENGVIYANDVKESYMPDGDKTYIINIPGQGRHMIKCTDEQLMITSMADMEKSPLSWEEFTAAILNDVSHRNFSTKKDKVQDKPKPKPKKVEKSKKPEKTPTKTAPTACQPAEPVDVWNDEKEAASEEETTEAAGAPDINPPEDTTEAAGEITALRQQVVNLLDQVKDEVVHGESWETIRDHIRDISKFITLSAF